MTLRGLWIHPRDGKPYFRTRRGGNTLLVRLPEGLPFDHPDFIEAWAKAAGAKRDSPPPPKAGTIASLWRAALDSREAAAWSSSFRATITRQATAICADYGTLPATAAITVFAGFLCRRGNALWRLRSMGCTEVETACDLRRSWTLTTNAPEPPGS